MPLHETNEIFVMEHIFHACKNLERLDYFGANDWRSEGSPLQRTWHDGTKQGVVLMQAASKEEGAHECCDRPRKRLTSDFQNATAYKEV